MLVILNPWVICFSLLIARRVFVFLFQGVCFLLHLAVYHLLWYIIIVLQPSVKLQRLYTYSSNMTATQVKISRPYVCPPPSSCAQIFATDLYIFSEFESSSVIPFSLQIQQ